MRSVALDGARRARGSLVMTAGRQSSVAPPAEQLEDQQAEVEDVEEIPAAIGRGVGAAAARAVGVEDRVGAELPMSATA